MMQATTTIKVIIVDDHALARNGLATFLEVQPDLDLVGMAASGEEAIELCSQVRPNIVLMDLIMPHMNGVAATRSICQKYPATHVIALTSFGDKDLVTAAIEAGASGYLLKDISGDELAAAIRKVFLGETALANEATRALMESVSTGKSMSPFELSSREREVLAAIIDGLSNAEIAAILEVKPSTVKTHVSRILSKLGVASRVEAATLAMKYKILD